MGVFGEELDEEAKIRILNRLADIFVPPENAGKKKARKTLSLADHKANKAAVTKSEFLKKCNEFMGFDHK